jgi:hypothetical protein
MEGSMLRALKVLRDLEHPFYDPRRPDFIDVECGLMVGTLFGATGFTGG